MCLRISLWAAKTVLKDAGATGQLAHRPARRFTLGFAALLMLVVAPAAQAQQSAHPAYDPRQFDQRFTHEQSERNPALRSRLPMATLARLAAPPADPTPLFVLRHVEIVGATAISSNQLGAAYQGYIDKKVSQADLAAIAANISDIYRSAGFHLSRAVVPPQDINEESIRVQVIEGSITALDVKGEGAEEFGVRQMLLPV